MRSGKKTILPSWLLLLILIAAGLLAGNLLHLSLHAPSNTQPNTLDAPALHVTTLLPEPRVFSDFHLLDSSGQAFTLARLKNHWSFIFFGYMNCPDICPATLSIMQQVWRQLREHKADMKQLQMIFVSVDPGRDQPQQLQDYVNYFDPAFIGVTGNLDEIDKLVNQAGILYGYEDEDEDTGNYVVNHSTQILLFDPQARLYATLSPPFESETIVHDLQSIQHYYGD